MQQSEAGDRIAESRFPSAFLPMDFIGQIFDDIIHKSDWEVVRLEGDRVLLHSDIYGDRTLSRQAFDRQCLPRDTDPLAPRPKPQSIHGVTIE